MKPINRLIFKSFTRKNTLHFTKAAKHQTPEKKPAVISILYPRILSVFLRSTTNFFLQEENHPISSNLSKVLTFSNFPAPTYIEKCHIAKSYLRCLSTFLQTKLKILKCTIQILLYKIQATSDHLGTNKQRR